MNKTYFTAIYKISLTFLAEYLEWNGLNQNPLPRTADFEHPIYGRDIGEI